MRAQGAQLRDLPACNEDQARGGRWGRSGTKRLGKLCEGAAQAAKSGVVAANATAGNMKTK